MRSHPSTRREFLRSFSFSAAALLGTPALLRCVEAADSAAQHLMVFGDWGAVLPEPQQKVATAMTAYLRANAISPSALLLLGDNFYGQLDGGTASPRWQSQFEQMYPTSAFACPCYAILGNHDYNAEPLGKAEAQLAYGKAQAGTRWTMPAKWYRFDFPAQEPLVTFVMLDSNYQAATPDKVSLTDAERAAQMAWLRTELSKPRTTKFLVVCGHHPLYSAGGDNLQLIGEWDALLGEHAAHLYFCGHVHDLEHLELPGHPTSFVVSGGGGTTLRQSTVSKTTAANQFGENIHGFTHLEVRPDRLIVRHVSDTGSLLHGFSKSAAGQVQIL